MKRKQPFTLVELLLAMVVFSIMLVLMMQFFSGARIIWSSTEKRNNMYADARIAMDLISTMLQNTIYAEEGIPFYVDGYAVAQPSSGYDSKLYFVTKTKMELPGTGDIRFISFQRGSNADSNQLQIRIWPDDEPATKDDFSLCFPPYSAGNSIANYDQALATVKTRLDNATGDNLGILLNNVTGFKVTPMIRSNTSNGVTIPSTSSYEDLPFMIEIQLSLMDKVNYDLWTQMTGTTAESFKNQHEYTFTRTVFIDDRNQSL
ncbi:prepilin-type N-terminal cleavage/methylation domain-containing protein [uncultured Victivallis sp.]|uniref:PilW family protein n=1 Tax=uncultured Victivallis sp. TaxID=354118 RepID=UPI00258A75E4|nr:prepilin-type N-terminal cleavage/methylation domain-containing protein [uncultured Victivallis sp.]